MSGWTEYVIADKTDAEAIAKSVSPKKKWRGFEGYKFLGPSSLALLCEVLGQEVDLYDDFPELASSRKATVYELPTSMTEGLTRADDKRLGEIAEAWSVRLSEEDETYSSKELLPLIQQIRDLLFEAKNARTTVLLWESVTT